MEGNAIGKIHMSILNRKICSGRGFVTYWLFVSGFHCIFMIYPWTANGMSWCSLYLLETRESSDERKGTKTGKWSYRFDMDFTVSCQGNDDDLSPCENSSVVAYTSTHAEEANHSNCVHIQIHTCIYLIRMSTQYLLCACIHINSIVATTYRGDTHMRN